MQMNSVLKVALTAAALMAATAAAKADFWSDAGAPYKGVTIRGVSESTPPSNYVKDVLAPAFTKATGINVEFEATSWDQMYDKAIKDMEANTGIYDFVYIEQDIIYSYLSRDFLVDITQSLKDNPKLAAPDFKVERLHLLHQLLQGRQRRHLRRADGGLRQGLPLPEGSVRRPEGRRKPSRPRYGYDLAPATTHEQYQRDRRVLHPVGQGQRPGAVGHHRPGAFGPSLVLVRVLRELGTDLRRLQLGHQRRQELRARRSPMAAR